MTTTLTLMQPSAVCEEADLRGLLTIGKQSVVHPKASIVASRAPIAMGERNIVEDAVRIDNVNASECSIGHENLFENGCEIRSSFIGNGNWFEPKSKTGAGSIIGNNCLIGSGVVVAENEVIEDNTVIVCVQDHGGHPKRLLRQQQPFFTKAREATINKYIDTFIDPKSTYAFARNHRILAIATSSSDNGPC